MEVSAVTRRGTAASTDVRRSRRNAEAASGPRSMFPTTAGSPSPNAASIFPPLHHMRTGASFAPRLEKGAWSSIRFLAAPVGSSKTASPRCPNLSSNSFRSGRVKSPLPRRRRNPPPRK